MLVADFQVQPIHLHKTNVEELLYFLNQLSPIRDETWNRLRPLFKQVNLKKGQFFIKAGQAATQIGFLQQGIIRVFYRNNKGDEYNKHFFMPPCFIGGYSALVTGTLNQINQEALTDCIVWVAEYKNLISLYDECPDLERANRRLAELFFAAKEQREIEIVTLDADERYRLLQQEFPMLEQQIPQYHIASYLGVSATQLSRIRRKLSQS